MVFVFDSGSVDAPFDRSVARLLGAGGDLLGDAAVAAFAEGRGGVLHTGVPHTRARGLVLPLAWAAAPPPPFLERFDGELELSPLAPVRSQLDFRGTCTCGGEHDRASSERLAAEQVRRFLALLGGILASGDEVTG